MERLHRALRHARELTARDPSTLVREALEFLRRETASSRVTLRRPDGERISVGDPAPARIELAIDVAGREASFMLERARPADDGERQFAEILAGAVALRIEHELAQRDAEEAARQLALLDTVTRAGEGERLTVSDVADRVASALRVSFSTVRIALHVVIDDRLELVARRGDDEASLVESAPSWLRTVPLDGDLLQAQAARERRVIARPTAMLGEPAQTVLEATPIKHVVVAPLVVAGTLIGTLTLAYGSTAYDALENLRLISGVADRLALELTQARRLEEEVQRARDLELIREIGSLVAQQGDLGAVLRTVVTELAPVAGVSRSSLLLASADRRKLSTVACNEEVLGTLELDVDGHGASCHAFRTRQPVVIDDADADPRANRVVTDTLGVRSILAVPLITKGDAIGVLLVGERHLRTFSKREVARVTAVANIVAPVIVNAMMLDDLRRSYEALSRAQAELVTHERLAALGELSAVIAHEVRNPLGVIYNTLGALRRVVPPSEDARLLLDIVGEEAARLNRIVADLLDFVRPYSSHPRSVELPVLVRGAIDGACRAHASARVAVETDIDVGVGPLLLDGTMIEQALTNLIVNARQATPPGGTVTVRVRRDAGPAADQVRLEVADEGPGVDEADAARIFQPFYTTKAAGTGLGLAVVRRIADALGGSISVARGPTRGATFVLTVPIAQP